MPGADINHLGNYHFVGATDNIRKRGELPAGYFARLKASDVDISKHLLLHDVSANPALLAFDADTYKAFRDDRLRHTFASAAGDLGFSELTIARLLGHSARGVTQGYVHLDTALIAAADRLSAQLAKLLDNAPAAKNLKRSSDCHLDCSYCSGSVRLLTSSVVPGVEDGRGSERA